MTVPDPSWKGQPDPTEREDTPCVQCGGKGYLEDQTYGEAEIPWDYVPIQRCDTCQVIDGDESAAHAYARDQIRMYQADGTPTGGALVMYFGEEHGDWAVCILPTPTTIEGGAW